MISKATMSVCKCSSRRVQNIVLSSHGGKLAMYSSGLYYRRAFSNTSSDGSADSAATDAPASPEAESQTALAKLTKEVKDLKDQLMRSYAGDVRAIMVDMQALTLIKQRRRMCGASPKGTWRTPRASQMRSSPKACWRYVAAPEVDNCQLFLLLSATAH